MIKEIQYEGYLELPTKPLINNGIFFPVSIEHKDLSEFGGDARSFGYQFDEGVCSIVKFEQAVGVLADETFELIKECQAIASKPTPSFSLLEIDKSDHSTFDTATSELLIRYGDNKFYTDSGGYWAHTYYCSDDHKGSKFRVSEESAELFREVNAEYQRLVEVHNKKLKQYTENLKLLRGEGRQN
jgi:hypothetical protein